jgi:phosphatidylserine/phosphatidylglycerophosphate/cardiolipin synthase-like enzyme
MHMAGRQPHQLLENGDNYYPAVFAAIDSAQQKVILETFIWFEDDVGKLHACCCRPRGVKIEVLLDGYGSPDLSDAFVNELTAAGVFSATTIPARACSACAPIFSPHAPQNRGDR